MSQRETQIWDNESQCYRRAVLHEALTHIRLTKRMTGDFPIGHDTIAEPGVYEAHLNPHGAVSIVAGNGKLLGLKPGEFEWVAAHAPTPAPSHEIEDVAFRNQNRLWLAENKLLEMNIEWQDGRGYVYNGKD